MRERADTTAGRRCRLPLLLLPSPQLSQPQLQPLSAGGSMLPGGSGAGPASPQASIRGGML